MIDHSRYVLAASLFILVSALAGCGGPEPRPSAAEPSTSPPAETTARAAAPSGGDARSADEPAGCEPTRPDMLGPFYEPNAPVRTSVGSGYVLSGSVLGAGGCEPVRDARIEFWLANPEGEYDDAHRATVLAGEGGRYSFESNVPVSYGGRPPHIHIRVTAPGYRDLVTQHYPDAGQTRATFDLVLRPLWERVRTDRALSEAAALNEAERSVMEGLKTITREELKEKMDRREDFVLLEVLSEASYRRVHLPGAIRFQNLDLAPELLPDRSAQIVAYCSNFNWHSSTRVVRGLTAMGYENAYEYEGGKQDWIEAGYPTESGAW